MMRLLTMVLLLTATVWANPIDDLESALQRNDLASVRAALAQNHALVRLRSSQLPPHSNTLLTSASRWGRLEIVRLAVESGADLEAPGEGGLGALALASQKGHAPVVAYLISQKARLDGAGSPLSVAAGAGQLACLKQLLEAGCPVNSHNSYGETGLHLAAKYDQLACAGLLLARHADVKAKDWQGRTPLALARSPKMRDLLKKAGP